MSRLQGIGTSYYGKKDIRSSDHSYVTTEWFVLLLLPIFPLKSFRVIKLGKQSSNYVVVQSATVAYKILEKIPLRKNISQIIRTYLFAYGGIALLIASGFLMVDVNIKFVWLSFAIMVGFLIWALVNSE